MSSDDRFSSALNPLSRHTIIAYKDIFRSCKTYGRDSYCLGNSLTNPYCEGDYLKAYGEFANNLLDAKSKDLPAQDNGLYHPKP